MKTIHCNLCLIHGPSLSCLLLFGLMLSPCHAQLTFEPSWQLPDYREVRTEILGWLEQAQVDDEARVVAQSLWPLAKLRDSDAGGLLDCVAETFAISNGQARVLVDACNAPHVGPLPPDADWLNDQALPDLLRKNLRLYYARWLAQHELYDEVLESLDGITPAEVVDPAGLLFYRLIAHQQLVQPDESRAALVQLLEHEDALPRRYQQLAQLVKRDLGGLKDESLDHIARQMNDVRRRLEIGRAGKQVQLVEEGVLDSLDQMIKKLEDQQKQQQSSSGGSAQSSKPMEDSQLPAGMQAPMKVDQRDIGSQSGWGDLPPKEREKALQEIGREFPAHYRALIEQYFRELADESSSIPGR
ncbi:MAG: hypothetical protein GXP28_06535 [Planctomycetes bacterium]|nr:hypothetical protein [Planctomycetota bacterium]